MFASAELTLNNRQKRKVDGNKLFQYFDFVCHLNIIFLINRKFKLTEKPLSRLVCQILFFKFMLLLTTNVLMGPRAQQFFVSSL